MKIATTLSTLIKSEVWHSTASPQRWERTRPKLLISVNVLQESDPQDRRWRFHRDNMRLYQTQRRNLLSNDAKHPDKHKDTPRHNHSEPTAEQME